MANRKPPAIKLSQHTDGRWMATSSIFLNRSFAMGATPDEAVAGYHVMLVEYEEFKQHIYGECDPTVCGRCKEGELKRGIGGSRKKSKRESPPTPAQEQRDDN